MSDLLKPLPTDLTAEELWSDEMLAKAMPVERYFEPEPATPIPEAPMPTAAGAASAVAHPDGAFYRCVGRIVYYVTDPNGVTVGPCTASAFVCTRFGIATSAHVIYPLKNGVDYTVQIPFRFYPGLNGPVAGQPYWQVMMVHPCRAFAANRITANDYALCQVDTDDNNRGVGDVLGILMPFESAVAKKVNAIGYPVINATIDGTVMAECSGTYTKNGNVGTLNGNFVEGSSGGPWLLAQGMDMAVGLTRGDANTNQPGTQFWGPLFDQNFMKFYNDIFGH